MSSVSHERVEITVPVSVIFESSENLFYARVENRVTGNIRPGVSIVRSADRDVAIREVLIAAGYRSADNPT